MMESATERKYIKGSRDHEEVKVRRRALRILHLHFWAASSVLLFHEDELTILYARYLNPLRKKSK